MVATINNQNQNNGKYDALYARYSSHSQDDLDEYRRANRSW